MPRLSQAILICEGCKSQLFSTSAFLVQTKWLTTMPSLSKEHFQYGASGKSFLSMCFGALWESQIWLLSVSAVCATNFHQPLTAPCLRKQESLSVYLIPVIQPPLWQSNSHLEPEGCKLEQKLHSEDPSENHVQVIQGIRVLLTLTVVLQHKSTNWLKRHVACR